MSNDDPRYRNMPEYEYSSKHVQSKKDDFQSLKVVTKWLGPLDFVVKAVEVDHWYFVYYKDVLVAWVGLNEYGTNPYPAEEYQVSFWPSDENLPKDYLRYVEDVLEFPVEHYEEGFRDFATDFMKQEELMDFFKKMREFLENEDSKMDMDN